MSDEAARRERVTYLDRLKALGVFAVVLYHSHPPGEVASILVLYQLALFYFASGALYKEEYSRKPWTLARKRLKTLYLPFVAWNFFYLALHNVLFHLNVYSDKAGFNGSVSHLYPPAEFLSMAKYIVLGEGLEQMAGALGFVFTLFLVNIVFVAVSYLCLRAFDEGEWVRLLALAGLLVIGMSNQHVLTRPATVNTALVAASVFYMGFLYRRFEDRIPLNPYLAILAAGVLWKSVGGIDLAVNQYASAPVMIAGVAAGVYLNVYLAKGMGANRFVEYVGKNSFFVIATHFLAFKVVSLIEVYAYHQPAYMLAQFPVLISSGLWFLAYFVVGILLPVGAKFLVDRVKDLARPYVRGGFRAIARSSRPSV
jgi:fucose 4-O-acetylase-like acetyltransferase